MAGSWQINKGSQNRAQGYWITAPKSPQTLSLSTQALDGLKAIILIKINLKCAAHPIVQHKRPQNTRRKTNTAAIYTLGKNGFGAAFIQALKFFG
jgi:hypothetical protein